MADITSADFKQLIAAITSSNDMLIAEQAKTTQKIEENTRESLRSSGDLAGFDRREEQKQRDEEAARDEEQAAAEAEAARIAAEKAEKNGTFLGKITNFFSKPDAADEEDEEKKAAKDSKMLGYLKSIGGNFGDLVDKGKEKAKSGIKGMLGALAFGGFAVAILAFLKSPYFDKFLKVINDEIVPALTYLIDKVIIPVGKVIWGGLVKTWENIKVLFSDLKESFALFGEGKWVEGIIKFFASIGTFLIESLDVGATALFNAIGAVFGFEGTDSVFGSIGKFFTDMYDTVVEFVSNAYNSLVELITNSMIFKFFQETFQDIIDSIKAIFSGEDIIKNLGKLAGSLYDIVLYPINVAINLIKDIFGFGSPDEPFRLSKFIFGAIEKIINFFKNLLDFDIKSLIMKLPGAETVTKALGGIGKFFSGGDDKEPKIQTASAGNMDAMMAQTGAYETRKKGAPKKNSIEYRIAQSKFNQKYGMGQARDKNFNPIGPTRSSEEVIQAKQQMRDTFNPPPVVVNAPTNVNAPSTTNMSSASTSMINTDRVSDKLSMVF